ncbi:hypothetical protein ACFW7J_00685 [Streptomyces sp. NPDC059525]|uniref:hypothetical protein n=1 Tax=Streptomyces sp. NPDC059525 TaxID=3346857 RepID=UPI003682FAA2
MQNLRMDFLMLLPGNRRVVPEAGGRQHYTHSAETEPDSTKYAATMDGDRAQPLLAAFFAALLERSPAGPPQVPLAAQG